MLQGNDDHAGRLYTFCVLQNQVGEHSEAGLGRAPPRVDKEDGQLLLRAARFFLTQEEKGSVHEFRKFPPALFSIS